MTNPDQPQVGLDDLETDFDGAIAAMAAAVEAEIEAIPRADRSAYFLMQSAERVRRSLERRLTGAFWPDFLLDDNLSNLAQNIARFRGEFSPESRGLNFIEGAQAMREMLARFVEQGGDATTAASLRANWNPSWGMDPGPPEAEAAA